MLSFKRRVRSDSARAVIQLAKTIVRTELSGVAKVRHAAAVAVLLVIGSQLARILCIRIFSLRPCKAVIVTIYSSWLVI